MSEAFGQFWRTDQRIRLTERLRELIAAARNSGIVSALVIDGSYVTSKEVPNDIDVLDAVRADMDLTTIAPTPLVYNMLSKRSIRRTYQFDAFVLVDGSVEYLAWLKFFSQIRPDDPDLKTTRSQKGLLRIVLCSRPTTNSGERMRLYRTSRPRLQPCIGGRSRCIPDGSH